MAQDEIQHFKLTTFEKNSKPFQYSLKQRFEYITSVISERSGAPPEEIDQVDKIFSLYVANRSIDSVYAYKGFTKTVDTYVKCLSSGDEKEMSMFKDKLNFRLANKTVRSEKRDAAENPKIHELCSSTEETRIIDLSQNR